jgi:hypothetical protein
MSLIDDCLSEFKMKEHYRRIGVNKHLALPITIEIIFFLRFFYFISKMIKGKKFLSYISYETDIKKAVC